ncbi:hypothetical protein GOP47_0028950 [Adiantum capillus-veneris]|nr:hypothetical protein GOP47_0028950 [Adiantum capillus-veneris]
MEPYGGLQVKRPPSRYVLSRHRYRELRSHFFKLLGALMCQRAILGAPPTTGNQGTCAKGREHARACRQAYGSTTSSSTGVEGDDQPLSHEVPWNGRTSAKAIALTR